MADKMSRPHVLRAFFEKDAKKVDTVEFMTFFKALGPEERQSFAESAANELKVELATDPS